MQKQTLTSHCAQEIQQLILNCKLLPGQKIKGEFLKSYLAVGLSPIREALSRLVNCGLVEVVDNSGFRVPHLSVACITDFYTAYAKLESWLGHEAIQHATEEWESRVVAALYQLAKIENTATSITHSLWSRHNEYFHEQLISSCPLLTLKQWRASLNLRKEWYQNLAYADPTMLPIAQQTLTQPYQAQKIQVNHNEHSQIAELALARKAGAVSAMLYKHTMHSLPELVSRLTKRGYLTPTLP